LRVAEVAAVDTETALLGPFEAAVPGLPCAGPALTVAGRRGDNRVLYRGLEAASPGDVLIVALEAGPPAGHWGELLTLAALRSGVAGLVIAGEIRDRFEIGEARFPVFFRGSNPFTAGKAFEGSVGESIVLDGVTIASGDVVVADNDGVVAVHRSRVEDVRMAVAARRLHERGIIERLRGGAGLNVAFGLEL
jgi:4-hydroxy-4-methyl-2-oxoglutarate aldolase